MVYGIKGIRIVPSAPAFITPAVLKVIQDKFDLKLITTPQKDLTDILKKINKEESVFSRV